MKMRVPDFATIYLTDNCKQARSIWIDYLWYNNKLISENSNKNIIPSSEYYHVRIGIKSFGPADEMRKELKKTLELWRFDQGINHKKYPIVFYPRFFWVDKVTPPTKESYDTRWGILGVQDMLLGSPFTANCSIAPSNPNDRASVISGSFVNQGDSKCRGTIRAVKGEKAVEAMIDVWSDGAPYIDVIYKAAVQNLQDYIQEN